MGVEALVVATRCLIVQEQEGMVREDLMETTSILVGCTEEALVVPQRITGGTLQKIQVGSWPSIRHQRVGLTAQCELYGAQVDRILLTQRTYEHPC